MTPADPRVTALASALVALIDGLTRPKASVPHLDELVPITAEALTPLQFEHRAVVRLAEAGQLRTVRIGRRRYTRASWLAELADKLPIAASHAGTVAPAPVDELMMALRGQRRRSNGGVK